MAPEAITTRDAPAWDKDTRPGENKGKDIRPGENKGDSEGGHQMTRSGTRGKKLSSEPHAHHQSWDDRMSADVNAACAFGRASCQQWAGINIALETIPQLHQLGRFGSPIF